MHYVYQGWELLEHGLEREALKKEERSLKIFPDCVDALNIYKRSKKQGCIPQTAYWLKLMKEIPETRDKFRRYIEHLREKYRRRPAFIDEIRNI